MSIIIMCRYNYKYLRIVCIDTHICIYETNNVQVNRYRFPDVF